MSEAISGLLVLVVALCLLATTESPAADKLDPARLEAVAKMLPAQPVGLGKPASDRATWAKLGEIEAVKRNLATAERFLKEPLPEQPDELFLEFSRTGNRTNWQTVSGRRRGRLSPLVLAECLEYKGRFLPALEELLKALCAEKTWVMPAHDGRLMNFEGRGVDIDLASSALGWHLATTDWLLGDKLTPATRALLRERVNHFVIEPYLAQIRGKTGLNWWLLTTNNWNAVCLAGVTGTCLTLLENPTERAEVVVAAEHYSENFLKGFPSDGYCTEGLGYWDYGFGNYVLLCETLWQATGGQADPFLRPASKMPAQFGARIQIINGVAPAFADCSVNARPDATTMWYGNQRFGLGLAGYGKLDPGWVAGDLIRAMMFLLLNSTDKPAPAAAGDTGPGLRTWFDQAGILIGRPQPGSDCLMGVALKGGHNAEHHNHNDLGSYVVVLGDRPVLLDPGAEVYTRRTFSAQRYDSKLLNSYGHPVPVIAGKLQEPGADRKALIVRADLTDAADTLELDITSAYAVPDLKRLTRTFVYSRAGQGQLTITDHVVCATPRTFGTAVLTLGKVQIQDDKSLLIWDTDQAVKVTLDTGGRDYTLTTEEIKEDGAHPQRVGINLTAPVTEATVKVTVTPTAGPAGTEQGGLLKNGGFEAGNWGWQLPANSLGTITDEKAAGGKFSLKITDPGPGTGSNINSARFAVKGGGKYVLRGKVWHVSGSGIGMYVILRDANGQQLNPPDAQGNAAPIGTLSGAVGNWESFALKFDTPPGTTTAQLWLHSYQAAQVEAYLDDLEVVAE